VYEDSSFDARMQCLKDDIDITKKKENKV